MINPINQKELRRFLYRMGFPRAIVWGEEKLRMMAYELVYHFKEEDIPRKHLDLFNDLKKWAKTGSYMEWAPPQRKKENVHTE